MNFQSPATSPTGSLASQKGFSSSASKDWGELRTVDVFRVSGKGAKQIVEMEFIVKKVFL